MKRYKVVGCYIVNASIFQLILLILQKDITLISIIVSLLFAVIGVPFSISDKKWMPFLGSIVTLLPILLLVMFVLIMGFVVGGDIGY